MAPHDRSFIRHEKALFDPALLGVLAGHFALRGAVEHASEQLTERERAAIARGESSDAFRKQDVWYDVWRDPARRQALLAAVAPFTYVTFPVQVRHVRALGHTVPWHQDAGYMRLLDPARRHASIITCFIPLEPEPARCTTIQFAALKEEGVELPHAPTGAFGAGIALEEVESTFHFDLALGDALVFGDLAVHRAFIPPGAQVERRSLEFRLIDPRGAMPGRDYFSIEHGSFLTLRQ